MSEITDFQAELDDLSKEVQQDAKASNDVKIEAIKDDLAIHAKELSEVNADIADLERQLKIAKGEAEKITEDIRKLWGPFIKGTEYAELDLGNGIKLISDTKTNVKVEDEDAMVAWMMNNGYKEVFKYQIHAMTRNKIVTDLFRQGNIVPGTQIGYFNVIKLK